MTDKIVSIFRSIFVKSPATYLISTGLSVALCFVPLMLIDAVFPGGHTQIAIIAILLLALAINTHISYQSESESGAGWKHGRIGYRGRLVIRYSIVLIISMALGSGIYFYVTDFLKRNSVSVLINYPARLNKVLFDHPSHDYFYLAVFIAVMLYIFNKLRAKFPTIYLPCPYKDCLKSVKVYEKWKCDYCHNEQKATKYITEACDHCGRKLEKVFCEHCNGEITL